MIEPYSTMFWIAVCLAAANLLVGIIAIVQEWVTPIRQYMQRRRQVKFVQNDFDALFEEAIRRMKEEQ